MIAKIIRAYVRHYSDNGQTKAYVEWVDHRGERGRTEGDVRSDDPGRTLAETYGVHMGALFARALCMGLDIEREVW